MDDDLNRIELSKAVAKALSALSKVRLHGLAAMKKGELTATQEAQLRNLCTAIAPLEFDLTDFMQEIDGE